MNFPTVPVTPEFRPSSSRDGPWHVTVILTVSCIHAVLWMATHFIEQDPPPLKREIELEVETVARPQAALGAPSPQLQKPVAKVAQKSKSSPPTVAKPPEPEPKRPEPMADKPWTPSESPSPTQNSDTPEASDAAPPAVQRRSGTANVIPNSDVDYSASYLHNPKPEYPLLAYRLRLQGEVLLRVEVLENGTAGQIELVRSSGHALLDRAAWDTVKTWKFKPAQRQGAAIRQTVDIPITFRLLKGMEGSSH